MEFIIKITSIENVTHDVKRFRCEKPEGYNFIPGQATEVSINKENWNEEKRPFTFTALNDDPFLEFTIKIYSDHAGVTNELNSLKPGDELIVRDVWGAIEYKGPGYFIAGGAGITPFIAILRQLKKENQLNGNRLFFSNKTGRDIILHDELTAMLNGNAVYVITDEPAKTPYHNGFINEQFLKEHVDDFSKHFYLCGPPKMIEAMQEVLTKLGAAPDAVIFEK
jgi:ferredoxin-NADP reductase